MFFWLSCRVAGVTATNDASAISDAGFGPGSHYTYFLCALLAIYRGLESKVKRSDNFNEII